MQKVGRTPLALAGGRWYFEVNIVKAPDAEGLAPAAASKVAAMKEHAKKYVGNRWEQVITLTWPNPGARRFVGAFAKFTGMTPEKIEPMIDLVARALINSTLQDSGLRLGWHDSTLWPFKAP